MKRFSKSHHSEMHEINITPLLDLAFVLLVIFVLTTTPLAQDVDLKLPTAASRPKDPPKKPNFISVDSKGTLYLNTVPTDRGLLEAAQRVGIQHRARAPASCRETAPAARRPRTGPAGSRLPLVVNHGGRKLGERFEIRADQSKVIRRLQETLMAMSDESIAPVI